MLQTACYRRCYASKPRASTVALPRIEDEVLVAYLLSEGSGKEEAFSLTIPSPATEDGSRNCNIGHYTRLRFRDRCQREKESSQSQHHLYKRDFFFLFSFFPFVQRLRVSKLDSLFHLATCNFFIRMGLQDAPNKEKLEGKLPPRPDSPCMLRPEHVAPAAEDASEVQ